MTQATRADIESYYDERVDGKLRDFIDFNPRIEAAVETLAEWAPSNPRRVLEIGCGIGATSWRMARAWPAVEVVGVDISRASIDVASACFKRPNLSYRAGLVGEGVVDGKFDLVVLMDIYEHIAPSDRADLHAAIKTLLSDHSRVVMTFPTPHTQQRGRNHNPSAMQPVDEDIELDEIKAFARETSTTLAYYRLVGIWRYADYAHAVFGRFRYLGDVAAREFIHEGLLGLKHRLKLLTGRIVKKGERNYLGYDVGVSTVGKRQRLFDVSAQERRRCVAPWARSTRGRSR